jgi:hypothetical protein
VPPSESASPSSCCRQNRAVIRAAAGDFLATLGARPPGMASRPRKLVRHCRAHAGVGVGTASFRRVFLPHAAGERQRTAVSGHLAGQPDAPPREWNLGRGTVL